MERTAKAVWKGSGTKGSGTLTTQSGVLNEQPYTLKLRFENKDGKQGTNPDELIAAALSSCYVMALSVGLEKAGYTADTLDADAALTLSQTDGGWEISKIDLTLKASVPGISDDEFDELARGAKDRCPVSQVLNCEKTLDYTLN